MVLLIRAYKTEQSFQKIKETMVYAFSEYLGSRLFPDPDTAPEYFLFKEDHRVHAEYAELVKQGKDSLEIDRIMREKAFLKIKAHPVKYIIQTPIELLRMASFMYIPMLNDHNIIDRFKDAKNGLIILSVVRGIYKFTSFIILALFFISVFFRKIQWRKEFILLALIVYVNIIYSILYGYPRYSVPLIPFYFIFAVSSAMSIFKKKAFFGEMNKV